jgi:hypothetical protein
MSFYSSILIMTGNDIGPTSRKLFYINVLMLICGALMNANIFGTIANIFSNINRRARRFQEQIDVANTSMKNMKLPQSLQGSIREFMMFT